MGVLICVLADGGLSMGSVMVCFCIVVMIVSVGLLTLLVWVVW